MLSFKYYRTTELVLVVIFLAIGIDLLLHEFIVPFLKNRDIEFMRAPGNVSIILMLLTIYDRALWKLPFFKLLVKVPNISGRYKGQIKYEFQGSKGEKTCYIEVKQTASKIKIHSYFNNELNEKN